MAEVKNTRKKPTVKKTVQNAVDTPAEDLEQTATETAATVDDSQPVAEKPVKKKSSKQPAKTAESTQQDEIAVSVAAEQATEDNASIDEAKTESTDFADELKADEVVVEDNAVEQSAEVQLVPVDNSKKPVKASGKKLALSKRMIVILAAVLAVVIIAVILAVCLTSCNGGENNKKYTVTFMVDGEVMTTYTVSAGEVISEPKSVPTKDMHRFAGWVWENPNNSSQTQIFDFGTKISQNITLVAKFRGDTWIKVKFSPNGGAFAENKQVELLIYDEIITEPVDKPTRVGYLFDGWFTEEECYNKFTFGANFVEDFTLYAGWAKDPDYVYISYYGNGELLNVDPVKLDEDVELPELFDSSVIFSDWCINNNSNAKYTGGKATEDLELHTYYYTEGLKFSATRYDATVIGYDGMATEVVVPPVYNGVSVKAIGAGAFYRTSGLPAITSVKLPDTITEIGEEAFYDCQYLSSINITNKVTTIGADAFYRNIRLRSVGDTEGVTTLGAGAFNGCKELRGITLSPFITEIGEYTFNDCAWLADIELPESLLSIGEYAFSGCTSLTSVVLSSKILNTIGDNAFAGCTNLTEVTIQRDNSAVELEGNPFADCRKVTIYVPSALLDTYNGNTAYSQFKDKFAAIR